MSVNTELAFPEAALAVQPEAAELVVQVALTVSVTVSPTTIFCA